MNKWNTNNNTHTHTHTHNKLRETFVTMAALIFALTSQVTSVWVNTLGIHKTSHSHIHRSAITRENHSLPKMAVQRKNSPIPPPTCIVITQFEVPHYEACTHSQAYRDTAGRTIPPPALFATPGLCLGLHVVFWLQFLQRGGEPSRKVDL